MKSQPTEYIKTPSVKAILKLSDTAVECSSYFAIRGVRGVGKTTAYTILINEWGESKSSPTPHYYKCMPDDDSDQFFRGLSGLLARKIFPKKDFPAIRGIIDEVGGALGSNKSNFLFLDDVHHVDELGWSFLITLFDSIRHHGIRLGMAVTDRFLQPEFRTGRPDPALIDIVHLKALDSGLTFAILEQNEPRIGRIADAYYKGDRKVGRLVQVLHDSTNGNFLAIDSLLKTMRENLGKGQATEMDIKNILSLRVADVDSIKNQFQLTS
jgi:hypothetical protein